MNHIFVKSSCIYQKLYHYSKVYKFFLSESGWKTIFFKTLLDEVSFSCDRVMVKLKGLCLVLIGHRRVRDLNRDYKDVVLQIKKVGGFYYYQKKNVQISARV